MKLLNELFNEDVSQTPQEAKGPLVPNKQPLLKNFPYKIAVVGEAPGADEVDQLTPFVGMSGRMLTDLLSKAGIVRDACFIGNVCQYRPPGNDITKFSREGKEFEEGLSQLSIDLATFNPNVCLLLGRTPLWFAKGVESIGDWRGSVFISDRPGPFMGRKCISAYHPAACLRQYEWAPLLIFDIKKCLSEAQSPLFEPPVRQLAVDYSFEQTLEAMRKIIVEKPLISVDIEGGIDSMSCMSIAPSADYSFIVPFAKRNGLSYYDNPDEEVAIWRSLATILGDAKIPKVLQNSLYDRFVLQYSYHIIMRGVVSDTMLQHHELYCELEKSLGFQCSIYTNEPYYKSERKTDDRDTFFRYCCRDSAVTYEITKKLEKWLDPGATQHYRFNIDLLNPLLYMELRGIKYDSKLAKRRLLEVNHQIYELQHQLDTVSGVTRQFATRADMLTYAQDVLCYKRDRSQPKKGNEDDYQAIVKMLTETKGEFAKSHLGFFNIVCGLTLNIKSKTFKDYLYKTLQCPPQYHNQTGELTTNYEALLKISKKIDHPAIQLALQIGELRTRAQMLEISCDRDGRVRCGYNVVGTETTRLTCYTSPTGSGYNLQTIPAEQTSLPVDHPLRKGMRDLFEADVGYYMFQCDLAGADGFTVAAHLASLGDRTMLDDYLFGIKPAKVLCYLMRHGATSLTGKSREEVKNLVKEVAKDSWDYFCAKVGQHGSCYLMGKQKLSNQIFIQSEGKVNISPQEAGDLQRLFFIRYRVQLWHDWMTRHLAKQSYPPKLITPSGHTRRFFGRYNEILGEALAHEPQANTTYVCNRAAHRLWTDPDNRLDGKLRIEPLHQIHDAILGQFKIEDTQWAIGKIREYFNNPIVIAGQKIAIGFEGQYGTNWALDDKSKIGDV